MSDSEATIIATIEKNSAECVVVALDAFKGVEVIDVRVFAKWGGHDKPRPTKKGVSLKIEQLPKLVEALQDAAAEARRRGLLPDERSPGAIRQERYRQSRRNADDASRNNDDAARNAGDDLFFEKETIAG